MIAIDNELKLIKLLQWVKYNIAAFFSLMKIWNKNIVRENFQ